MRLSASHSLHIDLYRRLQAGASIGTPGDYSR
ncbi:hypothetical protein FHY14_000565 [Xanthomonas arboricola]|nr:hypothetical protein [Xanthomonas arboricola]